MNEQFYSRIESLQFFQFLGSIFSIILGIVLFLFVVFIALAIISDLFYPCRTLFVDALYLLYRPVEKLNNFLDRKMRSLFAKIESREQARYVERMNSIANQISSNKTPNIVGAPPANPGPPITIYGGGPVQPSSQQSAFNHTHSVPLSFVSKTMICSNDLEELTKLIKSKIIIIDQQISNTSGNSKKELELSKMVLKYILAKAESDLEK